MCSIINLLTNNIAEHISLIMLISKLINKPNFSEPGIYTFVNPFSYVKLRNRNDLLFYFEGILVDGFLLKFLLALFSIKVERVSFDMTSLAPEVFYYCVENNKKICIVGSDQESISSFMRKTLYFYPKLNVVSQRDGYFDNNEMDEYIEELYGIDPDFVVVGMGTPLQEEFLYKLWKGGWRGVGFTCGGFIHQTASAKTMRYYPHLLNRLNLRWIYRIYKEPNLIKRYAFQYPIAICLVVKDLLTGPACQKRTRS